MDSQLAIRLVPDELWAIVAPLLPPPKPRSHGGGLTPIDDRAVFAAVAYVVTTGCAWRHLPPVFGVSKATAHRRFVAWTDAGLWLRLQVAARTDLGDPCALAWCCALVEGASVRSRREAC